MADEGKAPGPFDVRTVKYLVRLMSRHELSEIDLRDGTQRIRLRRGPQGQPIVTAYPSPPPAAVPAPAPAPPSAAEDARPTKELIPIKSPAPGTFYSRPKPEEEPFVTVGTRVQRDTVVCVIEAMKVFSEVTADCNGVITQILVQDQQPVEYGQPLFMVDPTA